jgi:hypothetical protein
VLIATVNDRRVLRAMFHWATFPVPYDMPAMVDIWRGVNGQRSARRVARGISWTTDRDTACWFAMRFAGYGRKPLLIRATMPRGELFYPSNERQEFVVICFDAADAAIDGNPEDWRPAADRRNQVHQNQLPSYMRAAEG